MKEYIERAAVLNLLEKINPVDFGSMFDYSAHGAANECLHDARYGVESLPAADVAEVRHGRWELYGNDDDLGSSYFCSVCHSSVDEDWFYKHGKFVPFKHCPECAARMGKEDEHEAG